MEGRAGALWRRRPVARSRGVRGLLRRLLPSELAARGGAPGSLPRHPRRARVLRPRGEAARGHAAACVSPPAPLRSEGTQAALGCCRPAAYPHRGTTGWGGRLADMGSDQLGYPVAEGRLWRQASRSTATVGTGRPRQRAGEHGGVQGSRARRQAPEGKALGITAGPIRVGMAAGPVLSAPGGVHGAARGRPEHARASSRARGEHRWSLRFRAGSRSA
jgi:hypothetical protein